MTINSDFTTGSTSVHDRNYLSMLTRRDPLKEGSVKPTINLSAIFSLFVYSLVGLLISLVLQSINSPGPFAPHHSDIYMPLEMRDVSVSDCLAYPRPISVLVSKAVGSLPWKWYLLLSQYICAISAALPMWLFARYAQTAIRWPIVIICLAAMYLHPSYNCSSPHDFGAKISFIFFSFFAYYLAVWHRDGGGRVLFAGSIFLMAMSLLSKETFIPLAIMACVLAISLAPMQAKDKVIYGVCLLVSLTIMGIIVKLISGPFISNAGAYALSSPREFIANIGTYFLDSFSLSASVPLVFAIVALWSCRGIKAAVLACAISLICFVVVMIPNGILANHYFLIYSFTAVPLLMLVVYAVLSSILQCDNPNEVTRIFAWIAPIGLVICALIDQNIYGSKYSWTNYNANFNKVLISDIERFADQINSANAVLIFGLQQNGNQAPFNPFISKELISDLGVNMDGKAFFVVPDRPVGPLVNSVYTRMKTVQEFQNVPIDLVLVVDRQGHIYGAVHGEARSKIFIRTLKQEDVFRLHDHGVYTQYLRQMMLKDIGISCLYPSIRPRQNGVDAWVQMYYCDCIKEAGNVTNLDSVRKISTGVMA